MEVNKKVQVNIIHTTDKEQKQHKKVSDIDVFNELYRRLDITRRSRIKASSRLREKHELYEMASYIYSLLILILSVWVIGLDGNSSDNTTKILLIASLSLTFFTMFLGIKNYKERASNLENNYQQLNVLLNKMQRLEADKERITQSVLKELHRDYEKLIIGNENHLPIDYMTCNPENENKFKKEIKKFKRLYALEKGFIIILPIIFLITFLVIF